MPLRRFARRKISRRRPFRRSARKGRQKVFGKTRHKAASALTIRQPSGLPDRIRVKLRYNEGLTWSQAAGALAANVYRSNSLFDSDFTGVGGQPYLFDQWSAFYGSYRVNGLKITAWFSMNGGGGFNSCMIGITHTPSSTSFGVASQDLIQEQPYTRKKFVKMGNTSVGQAVVSSYMSTRKILGLTKTQSQDQDYASLVTTSPTRQWFSHVWCFAPDGNNIAANSKVDLTFYVEFFGRNRPDVS